MRRWACRGREVQLGSRGGASRDLTQFRAGSWAVNIESDCKGFRRGLCAGYVALLRQPASDAQFCVLEPFAGSSPAAVTGCSAELEGVFGGSGRRQPDPRQQKTGGTLRLA